MHFSIKFKSNMGSISSCCSQPPTHQESYDAPVVELPKAPQITSMDSPHLVQESEKVQDEQRTKSVSEIKSNPEITHKPEVPLEKVLEKPHEKSKDKALERKPEKNSEKNQEKHLEKPPEKSPENEPPRKSNASLRFHRGSFVHFTKGDIISMYTVVGTIGKGSFGRVYKVKHKLTKDFRAVKVLSKENLNDINKEKLVFEVEVLRSLDHPNILKVFEVYEDEKQFSIVTELCIGGELFDRITSVRRFSENIAASYMYQIMSAMLTCHEKGIVHRDLKPENILFINESEDSPLKVIDFGTSRKLEARSTLSSLTGTVTAT